MKERRELTGWWEEEVQRVYTHLIVAFPSCCELAVGGLVKVGLPSTSQIGTEPCKDPLLPPLLQRRIWIRSFPRVLINTLANRQTHRLPTSHQIVPGHYEKVQVRNFQEPGTRTSLFGRRRQIARSTLDTRRQTGRTYFVDGRVPPRCRIRRAS